MKVIRIFISSTFGDLKAERNSLQNHVFPAFKKKCQAAGYGFQAIDLRWGISDEAGINQKTMKICLDEIKKCQEISRFPNFMILLGDRYGWNPLPNNISQSSFEAILSFLQSGQLAEGDEDGVALLKEWYAIDTNVLHKKNDQDPPQGIYYLKARTGEFINWEPWSKAEDKLRRILRIAGKNVLARNELGQFFLSATAQEIVLGTFAVSLEQRQHVYCFARKIENKEEMNFLVNSGTSRRPGDFLDVVAGKIDERAGLLQEQLRERLSKTLPGTYFEFSTRWEGEGISLSHLSDYCKAIQGSLESLLEKRIAADRAEFSADEEDISFHWQFSRKKRRSSFSDQDPSENWLRSLQKALENTEHGNCFLVVGQSGSGRTTQMANLLHRCRNDFPNVHFTPFFVGGTPNSRDLRNLLSQLTLNLHQALFPDKAFLEESLPPEIPMMISEFNRYLTAAKGHGPILIFLDGIDQLQPADLQYVSFLVPDPIPPRVAFVLSILDEGHLYRQYLKRFGQANLFPVPTMSRSAAKTALTASFQEWGKILQPAQEDYILDHFEKNRLPLYLTLARERALGWRSFDTPVLHGTKIEDLIAGLIADLSKPEEHGGLLVEKVLSLLSCSRYGLSEEEILDGLAFDEEFWLDFITHSYHDLPAEVFAGDFFNPRGLLEKLRKGENPVAKLILPYLEQQSEEGRNVSSQKKGERVISPQKARFLTFVRNDKQCCHFDRREKSLLPGTIVLPRIIEEIRRNVSSPDSAGEIEILISAIKNAFTHERFLSADVLPCLRVSRAIIDKLQNSPSVIHSPILNRWVLEKAFPDDIRKSRFQIPVAFWTRLYADLEPYLTIRSFKGIPLINFTYPVFLEPVYKAFLGEGKKVGGHGLLAEYFDRQPNRLSAESGHSAVSQPNVRKTAELIFQSIRGDRWDIVFDSLLSFDFLETKVEAGLLFDLVNDLAEAAKSAPAAFGKRNLLPLIASALKYTLSMLLARPSSLFQCLYNHGWWHDHPQTAAHFLQAEEELSEYAPPWQKSEEKFFQLIQNWVKAFPDNRNMPWLRALRPPRTRLNSAEKTIFPGTDEIMNCIAVSPRGERVAGGTKSGNIIIWETYSGRKVVGWKVEGAEVKCLQFSPDGEILGASCGDNSIRFWFVGSMIEKFRVECWNSANLAFSPDGRWFVSHSGGKGVGPKPCLIIFDSDTGRESFRCMGHEDRITHLAVAGNGRFIASASADKTVRIWDSTDGRELQTLTGTEGPVNCLAISPSGELVIAGGNDKILRLYQVESGELLKTITGHQEGITSVDFSVRGDKIASGSGGGRGGSKDNSIRIWEVDSGRELNSFRGHQGRISGLKLLPQGDLAVSSSWDKTARLWDISCIEERSKLIDHDRKITCIVACDSAPFIATGSMDGTVRLWEASSARYIRTVSNHEWGVEQVNLSSGGNLGLSLGSDEQISLWQPSPNSSLGKISLPSRLSAPLVFSQNENQIAGSTVTGETFIWDSVTGKEIVRLDGYSGVICAVRFSRSDNVLLGGAEDGHLIAWDIQNGKLLFNALAHQERISSIDCSPDSTQVLTVSPDGTLKIWDPDSGSLKQVLNHDSPILAAGFSKDGSIIVFESKDLQTHLFNRREDKIEKTFRGTGGIQDFVGGRQFIMLARPANELAVVDSSGADLVRYFGESAVSLFQEGFWAIPEGNHLQILKLEFGVKNLYLLNNSG